MNDTSGFKERLSFISQSPSPCSLHEQRHQFEQVPGTFSLTGSCHR